MAKKLVWDTIGNKRYETGVSKGVLYRQNESGVYNTGYAWNGLISVDESPEGAEPTDLYADNAKYLSLLSAEKFKCTIKAYDYPDEFAECDGSVEIVEGVTIGQQSRATFGFAYRTEIGNDILKEAYGYKIHLVYGCNASPSGVSRETINESPSAGELSWEVSTTPVPVTGADKPTATLVIDSTKVDKAKLAAIEEILYGSDTAEPRLPLPDEIKTLMAA